MIFVLAVQSILSCTDELFELHFLVEWHLIFVDEQFGMKQRDGNLALQKLSFDYRKQGKFLIAPRLSLLFWRIESIRDKVL